jgi:hypothetical protein
MKTIVFKTAEQLLKEQNKGAASERGETNRGAAYGIDIGVIYNGK